MVCVMCVIILLTHHDWFESEITSYRADVLLIKIKDKKRLNPLRLVRYNCILKWIHFIQYVTFGKTWIWTFAKLSYASYVALHYIAWLWRFYDFNKIQNLLFLLKKFFHVIEALRNVMLNNLEFNLTSSQDTNLSRGARKCWHRLEVCAPATFSTLVFFHIQCWFGVE